MRGQVIYKKFWNSTSILGQFDSDILKRVSSDGGGRLLAFYVDKTTNKLVSDASTFEVDLTCLGKEV